MLLLRIDKVQLAMKYAVLSMPARLHEPGAPYELPLMKNDGPFFRPSIVGHEVVRMDRQRRLYHDYSADAVEKMELVLFTLSGYAQIEFANTRERVRRGSVVFLSLPCAARIYLKDEGCPWEFFYLFASDRSPRDAVRWMREQFGTLVHLPSRSSSVAMLGVTSKRLVRTLQRPANHQITACSGLTYSWFLSMIKVLQQHRDSAAAVRAGQPVEASEVLGTCHTIKEYARKLGYSPAHLGRKLARTWQKAPGRTLRVARLEEAASLLKGTDLSVWEIASRVGYLSTSSFIRAFHALFGMTPANFRHNPSELRPPAAVRGGHAKSVTTSAKGKRPRRTA